MMEAHPPSWGTFPFGQPNTVRPARMPLLLPADAMVIGVYPSAFHVAWRAPSYLGAGDGRTGRIAAMAVDVEPTVFWDGDAHDFEQRRAAWLKAVGFIEGDEPGQHGHIARTSPSTNGSSGEKVVNLYLAPLGIDPAKTAFTDICPVFMIKHQPGNRPSISRPRRRAQGTAIREEYDAVASKLGVPPCSLPPRIPSGALPIEAAQRFADRIVSDLVEATPRLVIGLGEEVWRTLLLLATLDPQSPVQRFDELCSDRYGELGSLTIGGRVVPWLSLTHPGQLRGKDDLGAFPGEKGPTWTHVHARWADRMRTSRGHVPGSQPGRGER